MLNAPRTIPFEFHVIELDGIVWLFDNSERTYCCSMVPACYLEPLYWVDGECDEILPDGGYYAARDVEHRESIPLELGFSVCTPDVDAWDEAREEAHANCRI